MNETTAQHTSIILIASINTQLAKGQNYEAEVKARELIRLVKPYCNPKSPTWADAARSVAQEVLIVFN